MVPKIIWELFACDRSCQTLEEYIFKKYKYLIEETMADLGSFSDDAMSECSLAMLLGVREYNVEKGVPFNGFIRKRLRGAIVDDIRRNDNRNTSIRNLDIYIERKTRELQRRPNAEDLNLSWMQARSLGERVKTTSSLLLVDGDENQLETLLQDLNLGDKVILYLYFQLGKTHLEIAQVFGLSETTIRNRVKHSLEELANEF